MEIRVYRVVHMSYSSKIGYYQQISLAFVIKYLKLSGLGEMVRRLDELAAEAVDIRSTLFSLLLLLH